MRFILTVFFIYITALGFCQEAVFSVDDASHKFSKTHEGQVLEHTFMVKNTGNAPLIISGYLVECGCTKVFFSPDPVLPNETTRVRVTFDTEGKAFFQDRVILLNTNTRRKTEKLRIKVNVIPHD